MTDPDPHTLDPERAPESHAVFGPDPSAMRPSLWVTYGLIAIEAALLPVSFLLAHFLGVDLARWLEPRPSDIGWGAAATLPMLAGYMVMKHLPFAPFRRIRRILAELVPLIFGQAPRATLLLAAAAAGIGEEAVFRGVFQSACLPAFGPFVAVTVASILFGAFHCYTPTYAILAFILGIYLGWLALATGGIIAPAIAHALYDYAVLRDILRHADSQKTAQRPALRPDTQDDLAERLP
jgi:membrane protease YdiL (CAAX protease family)